MARLWVLCKGTLNVASHLPRHSSTLRVPSPFITRESHKVASSAPRFLPRCRLAPLLSVRPVIQRCVWSPPTCALAIPKCKVSMNRKKSRGRDGNDYSDSLTFRICNQVNRSLWWKVIGRKGYVDLESSLNGGTKRIKEIAQIRASFDSNLNYSKTPRFVHHFAILLFL